MSLLTRLCLGVFLGLLPISLKAENLSPELDYFPSRLHAAIYRNWDIVPHERVANVLGTDLKTLRQVGKEMGLAVPKPLTPEEIRRNVEIVLRRNWGVMPRSQIEGLLGYTAKELDDFLGKEIFLRALLAGPPPDLTPLKYEAPNEEVKRRVKWFRKQMQKHLEAVSDTLEEQRLGYTNELCQPHQPADFIPGIQPRAGEVDLRKGWKISFPPGAGEFARYAGRDFAEYCEDIQHAKINIIQLKELPLFATVPKVSPKTISCLLDASLGKDETYSLNIAADAITIRARADVGFGRALVEIERRMAERGGPFLTPCHETNSPSFSPRFVSSYFSLMTDVLGQDLIDPFPDGYLDELFHQDADGVWVYVLLEDLVQSPVFFEIGNAGSELRMRRLRSLVQRAASHGLKVYIYLNEPRDQPLLFFEKYPDVKGHVEGNRAMLCTSTERVQKHLRSAFEKLFREVPGLGGVFVITASENWTNCYSRTRHTNCPRCGKRSPADVIAEVIRCMTEGTWAADPEAKFIVWDWSWHSVLGEEAPEQIIKQLPKGVALMADWERGTHIERGGIPMNVEEYSISIVGPSPRARLRSEQAKKFGYDYMAKIQLSTTWECGTVPFIPVPNLLTRKARAMQGVDASGAMASWTIGSYPSPNTEAFAIQNWNPSLSEEGVLRRIAAKRYGEGAAEDAVRGWTKLSEAFAEEFPFFGSYAPPLQHGPSLPLYRHDIPPPYGNATLFNCKDDWRHWALPYPADVLAKLLRHLADRWDEGMKELRAATGKMPDARRKIADRDLNIAWMVAYYYRAYAMDMEFYGSRDGGDAASMKRFAAEEIKNTEQALRIVRSDSRIGWEAELQYFYRPSDVMERLISLDAVIEPPEE